jgi:acyl-CoA synthetase (AMP-forming)/AMP-acid ligase II
MNLVQTLRERSELQPGVPALIDRCFSRDRVLSYSGLNRLVDFLSFELRQKKISPGDCVLFGMEAGQEMYGYLLAALQIGAVPVLYAGAKPRDDFVAWIRALEPKACLIPKRGWVGSHFDEALKHIPIKIYVGHVRSHTRWLRLGRLGSLEDQPANSPALICLVASASNHLAFRVWSQSQLHESVQLLVSHLKLKAGEIDLCASPLHLLGNLAAGLTSMVSSCFARSVERQIEKFKPTRIAAESPIIRRLLRQSFSPLHKVFITDAPLEPEEIDYFTGRLQHANIELIFYEDLPLASLSLREYERKGSATLVGNFFSAVEARISTQKRTDRPITRSDHEPNGSQPAAIGELVVRGPFLPNRRTLSDLAKEVPLLSGSANGDWCFTGAFGYFDGQARFWLTERTAK